MATSCILNLMDKLYSGLQRLWSHSLHTYTDIYSTNHQPTTNWHKTYVSN